MARAVKSPSSRPCSPRSAASGSCGSPSIWPAPGRSRRSPPSPRATPSSTAWSCWDDVFKRVAADYPDVETESVLVDAMSAKFVLKPEDLSVVVASNLNADILSDLGSALAGSLGLAASAKGNRANRACGSHHKQQSCINAKLRACR
ncbi:isocitrate/isopropylmalate family dehydrogenase [Streptomyces sp. NPDC002680]|uniref:isocitrate/isopropylmalate family dehydrogenase n=1 Tax=Streptomyces sp. NPDC002680 TaxID=3364659 RepID=UPI00367C7721